MKRFNHYDLGWEKGNNSYKTACRVNFLDRDITEDVMLWP